MNSDKLRELLERVRSGELSIAAASEELTRPTVADLGFARLIWPAENGADFLR